MLRRLCRGMLGLAALAMLVAGHPGTAAGSDDHPGVRFEVVVTNLTQGQIISPAVVATHTSELNPLFALGSPASPELAAVAEDAMNAPLIASLSADPSVLAVQTIVGAEGPIMPGESASILIDAGGRFRHVTVVGMLVSTNDAFFALDGVPGPRKGLVIRYSPAYDAGSEANNEDCRFIPGPPCGSPGVRATAGAEGYVHVHAGVHGIADLVPAAHDWRNPVAKVTIRRLP